MISNRNIINLILEIKKQVLQHYHCLINSLFLIERFYNVKKTKKTKKIKKNVKKTEPKKPIQKNRPTLEYSICTYIGVLYSIFIYIKQIIIYYKKIEKCSMMGSRTQTFGQKRMITHLNRQLQLQPIG